MEPDKNTPENVNVKDEKKAAPETPPKDEKKAAAPEKEKAPKYEKESTSGRGREPREKLSLVGWIACFWPLGVVPPLGVWLWLHYGVITAKEGFLTYVPQLAAVLVAFQLNSMFAVWFYREDKKLAEQHRRRIPEFYLHFWELICGWPGALYAQKKYHHKWRKMSYMFVFWTYVALNVLIVFCVIFPGTAKSIVQGIFDLLRGSSGGKA